MILRSSTKHYCSKLCKVVVPNYLSHYLLLFHNSSFHIEVDVFGIRNFPVAQSDIGTCKVRLEDLGGVASGLIIKLTW